MTKKLKKWHKISADDMDNFMSAKEFYQELNRIDYIYRNCKYAGSGGFKVIRYKSDALDYLPDIEYHNKMKNYFTDFLNNLNNQIEKDNLIIKDRRKRALEWIKKHGNYFMPSPTKK